MNRSEIRLAVAANLNQLAADEATVVSGQVTTAVINRHIDTTYRDTLFPYLSDKFPIDFRRNTYAKATYTASSTVSHVSGTTLTAVDAIFQNSMERSKFYIENTDEDEKIKIATYSSSTAIIMDSTVTGWTATDPIYVLGNVFSFGGDTTDIKEIVSAQIKYTADGRWYECDIRDYDDIVRTGLEPSRIPENSPIAYPTTVSVSGVPTQAIGFLPYPSSFAGQWRCTYIQKPPALTDATEPTLKFIGISDVIVNGTTAKCLRTLGMHADAQEWEEMDRRTGMILPRGTLALVGSYRPKNRNHPQRIRPSATFKNMIRGVV